MEEHDNRGVGGIVGFLLVGLWGFCCEDCGFLLINILALTGHAVEFIPEGTIGTADIYLDGIIYEIKSPKTRNTNTIEHRLKDAIRNQSNNLIIDSSRLKNMPDSVLQNWLIERCRKQPQIKRMLFINKKGQIVDVKALVRYN